MWRKVFSTKPKSRSQRTCLLFQRNIKLFPSSRRICFFRLRFCREKSRRWNREWFCNVKLFFFKCTDFELWRCMPTPKWVAWCLLFGTDSSEFLLCLLYEVYISDKLLSYDFSQTFRTFDATQNFEFKSLGNYLESLVVDFFQWFGLCLLYGNTQLTWSAIVIQNMPKSYHNSITSFLINTNCTPIKRPANQFQRSQVAYVQTNLFSAIRMHFIVF